MHPNRKFHITDRAEMAALVRSEGFGILTVQTEAGLRAVHVPVLLQGDRLRFHVSRGNLVHAALAAGAEALFVASGPHAYISADWYGLEDRVPTWSYLAVELNGPVRPLPREELVALLDEMVAEHEEKLAPKPVWTRARQSDGRFEQLLGAIAGFEMEVRDWRGTAKIDQTKPADARARVAAALRERGEDGMAALYSSPWPRHGEGDQAEPGGGARAERATADVGPEPSASLRAPSPRFAQSCSGENCPQQFSALPGEGLLEHSPGKPGEE